MKVIFKIILISLFFISCAQIEKMNSREYAYKPNIKPKEMQKETKQRKVEKSRVADNFIFLDNNKIQQEIVSEICKEVVDKEVEKKFESVKVAILISKKNIGKYANQSINSALGILLSDKIMFELVVFDSKGENTDSLQNSISKINSDNFDFIVAVLTQNGVNNLITLEIGKPIYISSVNKKQIPNKVPDNIIFGGIDYEEQLNKINTFANDEAVSVAFNDNGYVGEMLGGYLSNIRQIEHQNKVDNPKNINYPNLDEAKNINYFINTSVVKTSVIASQLLNNDKSIKILLSTQLNYNPLLLNLSQPEAVESMMIANGIDSLPLDFMEISDILNINWQYDFINYSTALGIAHMSNAGNMFNYKMEENQIIYPTFIVKPRNNRFILVE